MMETDGVRSIEALLTSVVESRHNGPKQLCFAIALARNSSQVMRPSKEHAAAGFEEPSPSRRLQEKLALLRILVPQSRRLDESRPALGATLASFQKSRIMESLKEVALLVRGSLRRGPAHFLPSTTEAMDSFSTIMLQCDEYFCADDERESTGTRVERTGGEFMEKIKIDLIRVQLQQIIDAQFIHLEAERSGPGKRLCLVPLQFWGPKTDHATTLILLRVLRLDSIRGYTTQQRQRVELIVSMSSFTPSVCENAITSASDSFSEVGEMKN